ncbi:MAG: aldehyde dehydrogenase family protein [Nitrososphaerales archaeon]
MFQNENTLGILRSQGKEEEFNASYEKSVEIASKNLGRTYPMEIGGKESFSSLGTFADTSPSDTSLIVGYFQKGTREDAKQAVLAAKNAFESWSSTPYQERVRIYRKAADLMSANKFLLAAEMTFENGKNRFEAIADVDEAIDFLRYYAEELEVNKGFDVPLGHALPNEHSRSILRPYGVWSVIAPFNFPLAIATGMSTGASITGNTIVLKPASDTPLLSYELYKIMESAGLPPGVFNFVTGPGSTVGAEMTENPNVAGVVFTGSWDVGSSSFLEFQKAQPRPFIAEMGGKNATVVTASADIEKATEGVMRAAFGYCGQKCSACSRVYVHDSVKDEFVRKLVEKTSKLKVGDPTERDTFLGPVINEGALKSYLKYVEEAKNGAKIATGGKALHDGKFSRGYYVEPTIFIDAKPDHALLKQELFVPILGIVPFHQISEVMSEFNSVHYGLTGGIFSNDKKEIDEFFKKAEAGVLYANRTSGSTTGAMVGVQSFVGWKQSGSSGKGSGGPYYLQQFLREQSQTFYD